LREEIVRQLHAGQMPEQHAMRMERALRLSGRAGGIDDQRRIFGSGIRGRECVTGAFQYRPEQRVTEGFAFNDQYCCEIG